MMREMREAEWNARYAHEMRHALTDREAEILKVACATYHHAGGIEEAIVMRLRMKVTTFWQLVNELIDTERGIAFDPVNVWRLRRLRETRRVR